MIEVTLPDGSKREFNSPVTVGDVAASIGAGLARAALAGKVNGKLVDLSHPITENSTVSIVTDKDPEGLEIIRHSTSHLMAQAVKELYPQAQITIGPVIENGFYYDFSLPKHLTNEDLPLIEKKMDEIVNAIFRLFVKRWTATRPLNISTPSANTTRPKSSALSLPVKPFLCTVRVTMSTFAADPTSRAPVA